LKINLFKILSISAQFSNPNRPTAENIKDVADLK
jgi:hypothetical protein